MSILQRIRNAIRIILEKPLGIEKPRNIAPRNPDKDGEYSEGNAQQKNNDFFKSVRVAPGALEEGTVSFKDLELDILDNLVKKGIKEIGGKLGVTHRNEPTLSGTLYGRNFVSIKEFRLKGEIGQAICTENGYYRIITSKDDLQGKKYYRESLTNEDGEHTYFEAHFGGHNDYVNSQKSKGGNTLMESAYYNIGTILETFAQPRYSELEYSEATGLPIIMDFSEPPRWDDKLNRIVLSEAMRERYPEETFNPKEAGFAFIVSIEASNEVEGDKKAVKYAYPTKEAYINGERPYMVYLSGIDGREGSSGMFRLTEDGTYIDNSTFRRDPSSGKYTYDIVNLEDIKALAGKFPTDLSERAKSAITGQFRIPEAVEQIYEKAISIENKKESPDKGIEISE